MKMASAHPPVITTLNVIELEGRPVEKLQVRSSPGGGRVKLRSCPRSPALENQPQAELDPPRRRNSIRFHERGGCPDIDRPCHRVAIQEIEEVGSYIDRSASREIEPFVHPEVEHVVGVKPEMGSPAIGQHRERSLVHSRYPY